MGDDLKTGSDKDSLTGFCVGLGLNMKMYQLEYAFVPFNELGYTHRASLGMKWGREKTEDRKEKTGARNQKKERTGKEYYKKGQRYCKEGKYQEAIKEYDRAINSGYKKASIYANMGYCYHKLGKEISARRAYKKALKLEPNNKEIKKNLDKLMKKTKSIKERKSQ
jgi:tetratricopeptide (TPR) repeat protein